MPEGTLDPRRAGRGEIGSTGGRGEGRSDPQAGGERGDRIHRRAGRGEIGSTGGRGEGKSDPQAGGERGDRIAAVAETRLYPGLATTALSSEHTTARPGCQCDPSEGSQRLRAPGPALFAGRIDYTSQAEMDHLGKAADNGMNHRESTLTAPDKSRGANPRLGGGGKGRVGRESEQRGWH